MWQCTELKCGLANEGPALNAVAPAASPLAQVHLHKNPLTRDCNKSNPVVNIQLPLETVLVNILINQTVIRALLYKRTMRYTTAAHSSNRNAS
jgi:hypothetical protein